MNPGAESRPVVIQRSSPNESWGFRLQGGSDFSTPLSISMVNPGSAAERAGLMAGDAVLAIGNKPSDELDHESAKREILMAGNQVQLYIQRGAVKVWKPKVTPVENLRPAQLNLSGNSHNEDIPYVKHSLAADKQESLNIGSSHNRSARPFPGFGGGAPAAAPVSSFGQQGGGGGGYDPYSGGNMGGGGMGPYGESQGGFNQNQGGFGGFGQQNNGNQGGMDAKPAGMRSVKAPITKPPSERKQVSQMMCKFCGNLVVGVFVRVSGEPIHPECFKCAQCGKNLKNQGHYTVGGQLYCDECTR